MPAADDVPDRVLFAVVGKWGSAQREAIPKTIRILYMDGGEAKLSWQPVDSDDDPTLSEVLAAFHLYAMAVHGSPARMVHLLYADGSGDSFRIPVGEWQSRPTTPPEPSLLDEVDPPASHGWDFSHTSRVAYDGKSGKLIGQQRRFLQCLVNHDGRFVDYTDLRRIVWRNYPAQDKSIYALACKVRKWLHDVIGVPEDHDPLPPQGKSYRILMP